MPEILSQNQIDELLKGINSGSMEVNSPSTPAKKIKDYDFRSPKKFTKEQLKALDSLHENLSRVLSSYFSGVLRLFSEVSVLQIEEQRYYEYNNALPDSALIGMLEVRPADPAFDEVTLMMDVSKTIGFFAIDRLLGGSGEGYNIERDFTDIEMAILKNVFTKITKYIQEVWSNYIEVDASLTSIETNSRLVQIHSPDDIVVIVLLGVKIKDLSGTISICIPAVNLEELIDKFSSKYVRTSKKQDVEKEVIRRQTILNSLTESDLEMRAVLQELQLDLQEVLNLQVNDVIPLNKKVNSDIIITVEETPWFTAKLGETKTRKAVKINNLN